MRFISKVCTALVAFGAALAFSVPAFAAFINIDDSDPNTITITAGDFEGGFSVNGTALTSGLGSSGSITLPDGGHSIAGSWIDNGGASGGAGFALLFALPADLTELTSGVAVMADSDGSLATLAGEVAAFLGTSYGVAPLPTTPQDGTTESTTLDFLTVSFTSEVPQQVVPEPATLALLGLGLAGLGAMRRRAK